MPANAEPEKVKHHSRSFPLGGNPGGTARVGNILWFSLPSLLVIVLGITFFVASFSISGRDSYYPRALVMLLIILGLLNLIGDLRAVAGKAEAEPDGNEPIEGQRGAGIDANRTWLTCVLLIVFVAVTYIFGFFPGVAVLGLGMMLVLGVRAKRILVLGTICMVAGAYVVFDLGLGVNFPAGMLA